MHTYYIYMSQYCTFQFIVLQTWPEYTHTHAHTRTHTHTHTNKHASSNLYIQTNSVRFCKKIYQNNTWSREKKSFHLLSTMNNKANEENNKEVMCIPEHLKVWSPVTHTHHTPHAHTHTHTWSKSTGIVVQKFWWAQSIEYMQLVKCDWWLTCKKEEANKHTNSNNNMRDFSEEEFEQSKTDSSNSSSKHWPPQWSEKERGLLQMLSAI